MNQSEEESGSEPRRGLSPRQVFGSAIASAFGVQSSRNRQRDFNQGKASHFIIAGFLFVTLFVITMLVIVHLVLSTAT